MKVVKTRQTVKMSLAIPSILILLFVLCVDGTIYLFDNTSTFQYNQAFEDILSPSGPSLPLFSLKGFLRESIPPLGCSPMKPADRDQLIVIIRNGNCTSEAKVRNAQAANYSAVIVHNVGSNDMVSMRYDNNTGIIIPAVFVSEESGLVLIQSSNISGTYVKIDGPFSVIKTLLFGILALLFGIFLFFVFEMSPIFIEVVRDKILLRRKRALLVKSIPKQKYDRTLYNYETCFICDFDFEDGEIIRILPCSHAFHSECIKLWITRCRRECVVCLREVKADSDDDTVAAPDDRTPLLREETEAAPDDRTETERLREAMISYKYTPSYKHRTQRVLEQLGIVPPGPGLNSTNNQIVASVNADPDGRN